MVSKETFVNICNIVKDVEERLRKDNKVLENLFNKDFRGNKPFDTNLMWFWPLSAVSEILSEILKDSGESKEGIEWFIYEGLPQIREGKGTQVDDFEVKSIEDYYDYLTRRNI